MNPKGITRRDTLKLSGLALGGLAVGGASRAGAECTPTEPCYPTDEPTHRYSLFRTLDEFVHPNPVRSDEMRITFIGSGFPPPRRAQQEMSIFVEVGDGGGQGQPDQVIFDVGSGVTTNYSAMGIGFGRMNKIFLNHLHGDHMGDLAHIYCFGPAFDRKSPAVRLGIRAFGREEPEAPAPALRRRHPGVLPEPPGSLPVALGELQLPVDGLRGAGPSHPRELGPALRSRPRGRRSSRRRVRSRSHRARLEEGGRRRLPQQGDRSEGHALPGGPLPEGLHGLQARVERLVHGLHERHQARAELHRRGPQQARGRGRLHPRDDPPAGADGDEEPPREGASAVSWAGHLEGRGRRGDDRHRQLPHPAGSLRPRPEPDRAPSEARRRHALPGGRRHGGVCAQQRQGDTATGSGSWARTPCPRASAGTSPGPSTSWSSR